MQKPGLPILAPMILAVALAVLSTLSVAAELTDRFERYSVLPFVEVQPGFTTAPRQAFTLDLGGIGRRPIEILAVRLNGRVLPAPAWEERLSSLVITPDRDLRLGLNRIMIEYNHPTDQVHRSEDNPIVHTFFVNHQRSRPQIEFGSRGELIVNGTRKFVRGGYRSGQSDRFADALPSSAEAGFNLVHDYKFESYDLKQLGVEEFLKEARRYLRRADELGLGVFFGLPRTAVREYDEQSLATVIAELAGERALWMWYIYDEPHPTVVSIENASKVYSLLRRLDPGRPSVLLTQHIDAMIQYHPFCDVLWYDRYPFIATSRDLSSLSPIAAAIQKSVATVTPEKPVWPVLQVHDNKGSPSLRKRVLTLGKPNDLTHRPNEAEIRAQTHLALANGMMSVVYYWPPESWYSMTTDTPGIWKSLSRVVQELRQIEPVLLSEEAPSIIEVTGGHNKTMMWQRRYRDSDYVGLVNASVHVPTDLVLQLPSKGRSARKLLGDGSIENHDGHVRVKLGRAGVVVIVLALEPADRGRSSGY